MDYVYVLIGDYSHVIAVCLDEASAGAFETGGSQSAVKSCVKVPLIASHSALESSCIALASDLWGVELENHGLAGETPDTDE